MSRADCNPRGAPNSIEGMGHTKRPRSLVARIVRDYLESCGLDRGIAAEWTRENFRAVLARKRADGLDWQGAVVATLRDDLDLD